MPPTEDVRPPVVDEPTAVERITAKAKHEQELRSGARSNGRAVDLVGAPEVGSPPPPEPIEPHDHGKHLPEEGPSKTKAVVLGLVYLGAGTVALTIGVLMLKDAFASGGKK